MSTNAHIGIALEDDQIAYTYLHWDGYPSHAGRLLLSHYNSYVKASELIALGEISVLAESIEKPKGHSFDSPVDGYTIFYGRDRKESGVETKIRSLEDFSNQSYCYLFKQGAWWWKKLSQTEFELLTISVIQ